jgi:hypothetical protein
VLDIKTGEFIVGKTMNIERRLRQHRDLLNQRKHKYKSIQKVWNKKGEERISFETVYLGELEQLEHLFENFKKSEKCINREFDNYKVDLRSFEMTEALWKGKSVKDHGRCPICDNLGIGDDWAKKHFKNCTSDKLVLQSPEQ